MQIKLKPLNCRKTGSEKITIKKEIKNLENGRNNKRTEFITRTITLKNINFVEKTSKTNYIGKYAKASYISEYAKTSYISEFAKTSKATN